MRISDWSSDVCSSDLAVAQPAGGVRCIHQNLVAVAERGKHGIAGHPDHRQIARIAERHAPEPVTAKGEAVGRAFAVGQGARPGRGPDVEARDKHATGCEGLILLRSGSPQFFLSDAEIARDSLSFPFSAPPWEATLDADRTG